MRLARLMPLLLALFWAALPVGASPCSAQTAAPAPAVPTLAAPVPPTAAAQEDPAARRAELESLARTLQDDQARARLIEQLRALAQAQPAVAAPEPPPVASFLDRLQQATASRAQAAVGSLLDLAASVETVPELLRWLGRQLTDEVSRVVWWTVLSQTGLAVALGLATSVTLRLGLAGWRRRRTQLPPGAGGSRATLRVTGAALLVDVLALATFLAVTSAALRLLDVTYLARAVATDVLAAVAIGRILTALSRAALATRQPEARLVPLTDEQARATRRWIGTTAGLAIYGHTALGAALRLGLPWSVHAFLGHLLFLIVAVLVVVAIFRVRGQVAAVIMSLSAARDGWAHGLVPWAAIATAGPYVLAAWVAFQYLVWALRIPAGTTLLTRGALGTILALALLRVLNLSLDRLVLGPSARAGGEEPSPADDAAAGAAAGGGAVEPAQASAARTLAVAALRFVGLALAAGIVLQAWGFGVTGWLASRTGREILGRALGVLTVAAFAAVAWYAVDRAARHYITAQDAEGNPVHDNRTRTLANIVRNLALTVALFVVVGHVLTALGVNAAALLAGAGVVGFAIGFGSQKLVQDLTTGLFILLGDTVRVGDVVQLGAIGGVVEAVSMRTVTLRDYNGRVHTIPYSAISIVTNMTKDYAFSVFNVTVGYREDVDRVMDVLRDIDSQMRREWPYRRIMLEPLEVAGVDAFTERGVVIVARSRTRAGEQWKVSREFNRRLKKRFDELGIEFPFPQQTVQVIEPPHDEEQRQRETQRRPIARPEVVRAEGAAAAAAMRGSEA